MNVLAVIPARGGSKRIPKKNLRLMHGKPLIYYAIRNAQQCNAITDTVVSTDDVEILSIAQEYGAFSFHRSSALADDTTTLDPVVYDAVLQMEKQNRISYDVVITLQATSPLLKPSTLSEAIAKFLSDHADTYISVVNKPHLAWSQNGSGFFPLYKKRLNRQQLPPHYIEAGAFLITRRQFVTKENRIGKHVSVYDIPECEGIDIDDANDWVLCENIMSRKRIVLRADGYKELGMGHIYHCLTLANNLIGHEIMFVTNEQYQEGLKLLRNSNYPLKAVKSDEKFYQLMKEYRPDIIVNDRLDTEPEYIQKLKQLCPRVITIEDVGEGTKYADAVINTLYETGEAEPINVYSGESYACLRDEFLVCEPEPFRETVHNVLVLFGGTDPSNLTHKVYDLARQMHIKYPDIQFTFLTGIGFDAESQGIVTRAQENITVIGNAKMVSRYMKRADLAFSSQGRTIYELASLGVPSIVMAQNERECLHAFAQMNNGFLNLGLGCNVTPDTLAKTFDWLVNTPQIRREMRSLMLKHPLKSGIKNEIDIILGV